MDTFIPTQAEIREKFNAKEKRLHATSKLKKEAIFNIVTYIDSNKSKQNDSEGIEMMI